MGFSVVLLKNYLKTNIKEMDIIFVFAALISLIESFAQNSLKQSSLGYSTHLFYVGLVLYIAVAVVLHTSYKSNLGLGKMNLIWSCISIISGLSVGYFLYGEKISKCTMASGILALSAIIVSHFDNPNE